MFFISASTLATVAMTLIQLCEEPSGDIVALLDSTGTVVVVSYVYDAWGRPISCSGTMANTLGKINPFRYRGYVYDEETRLYYLRSRYYIPFLCRFINADSICTPNLFSYCKNSPILMSDPNGNISLLAIAGGIATLLAAVLTPSTAQAPDIPPAPSAEEIAEAQAVEKFFDDIGNELGSGNAGWPVTMVIPGPK